MTVAPRRPPALRNPTIVRQARRHRDTQSVLAAVSGRRRGLAAAALAVCALGAVVAVVAAGSSGAHHTRTAGAPPGPSTQTIDQDLLGVLRPLAGARSRGLAQLRAAHTPAAQAGAAAAVARDYTASSISLSRLPAAVRASPPARQVAGDLQVAAQDWGALAQAARRSDRGAYGRAAGQIATVEARLQALTQRL